MESRISNNKLDELKPNIDNHDEILSPGTQSSRPNLLSESTASTTPQITNASDAVDVRDYGATPLNTALPNNLTTDPARSSQRTISPLAMPPLNIDISRADLPSTSENRRSVQFLADTTSHSRQPSWDDGDGSRHLGSSIMNKLKSLSLQSPRSATTAPENAFSAFKNLSASQSRSSSPTRTPRTIEEAAESDADADADAEETADEGTGTETDRKGKSKKKRKIRRPKLMEWVSSPNASGLAPNDVPPGPLSAGIMMRHRGSLPGLNEEARRWSAVVSEGEGRERLESKKAVKRGSGYWRSDRISSTEGGPSSRRGHMRRLTSFGGGGVVDGAVSDYDGTATPRRAAFFSHERAATLSAQGWNMVKSTLKMLRSKRDDKFNISKSAELISELQAGAPAAMLLASYMQRDEHGNKRIPVLLDQLHLMITDSKHRPEDDSERHSIFTISLVYGSGASSMQWTITRTLSDIYQLHLRYRMKTTTARQEGVLNRYKQPKFPWAIFPWFRSFRSNGDMSDEEEGAGKEKAPNGASQEGETQDDAPLDMPPPIHEQQPHRRSHSRSHSRSQSHSRRQSMNGYTDNEDSGAEDRSREPMRARHVERQRRALEKYLIEMIKWLRIRPDSNRMCRFLELSALGVRLAAEGSYHGKEGYLHIQSSKGLDFRRVLTPGKVIARHSRKWFLIRQSYIVCVESPENMNIYDVYLVDAHFEISHKKKKKLLGGSGGGGGGGGNSAPTTPAAPGTPGLDMDDDSDPAKADADVHSGKHHRLTLRTSERKVKLFSRNHSVMQQFETSMRQMLATTPWHQPNRFDSFGPIRYNVHAQWLVDGRDYMWNVSRAIMMARDVIYIHDWWLSPELYMRRPAAISQKWRLDRLLQTKAQEGVKVFVIVYRNVEAAIPIDSTHTKFSLLNLHPNIFIQRSPHQFKKNQFIYAHHEKLCIVDHDIAFLGGIDLCFGRWDSPQHRLTDDKPTGFEPTNDTEDGPAPRLDPSNCQMFPGKDYSNPRVQDFYRLNEPYEEMYDRSRIPRMPWHDVAMQIVGQPARDLTRHFVQRWNYIRRGRKATRPLPFLLPPPDAKPEQLEALGLTGTCEAQLLRSAGNWSLGTSHTEHSIQNAYIKMIEDSEHFVYIENQFFVTSSEFDGVKILNRIGDALVARAMRAHHEGHNWRCVVIIPLMPGFQNTVDDPEGTSIRLILESQYRSISRGRQSIFGRLTEAGIAPDDYIQFFSLRQWGKLTSGVLVTEQLYIHAKIIIVDDRVALIGSANINERSMLGDRDSEVAAIIRDTDMMDSRMDGKPYKVGRFAHTLRIRLMREHLGLDVDEILEEELAEQQYGSENEYDTGTESMVSVPLTREASASASASAQVSGSRRSSAAGPSGINGHVQEPSGEDTSVKKSISSEDRTSAAAYNGHVPRSRRPSAMSQSTQPTTNGDHHSTNNIPKNWGHNCQHPFAQDIYLPPVDKECMRDPIAPEFIDNIWSLAASNNTKLYRCVFRCMPDNHVETWNDYRDYTDYAQRFQEDMERRAADNKRISMGSVAGGHISHPVIDLKAAAHKANEARLSVVVPPAAENENVIASGSDSSDAEDKAAGKQPAGGLSLNTNVVATNNGGPAVPSSATAVDPSPVLPQGDTPFPPLDPAITLPPATPDDEHPAREKRATFSTPSQPPHIITGDTAGNTPVSTHGTHRRRKRTNTKSSKHRGGPDILPQPEAEELLGLLQGTLVEFPHDWLLTEENKRNWGYQVDHVAPLQIYI